MNATTAPELATLAAEAWRLLLADPVPVPSMVVDWLREKACCEDVEAVKLALYGAAATSLDFSKLDESWQVTPLSVIEEFKQASWPGVTGRVSSMRHFSEQRGDQLDWLAWCDKVDRALALCRAIEAA